VDTRPRPSELVLCPTPSRRPELKLRLPLLFAKQFAVRLANSPSKSPWPPLLLALGLILTTRYVVFSPFAMRGWARVLEARELGFRQHDVVRQAAILGRPAPAHTRWLAMGSSQAARLWTRPAVERDDVARFTMSGMSPFDLWLHREVLDHWKPEGVLLYLSGFDMARPPALEAMPLAPPQRGGWPVLLDTLRLADAWPEARRTAVRDLAIGELLPEYRWRFLPRGLVQAGVDRALLTEAERTPPPRRPMPERVALVRDEGLTASAMNLHFAALERFLDETRARGIDVVIVQGEVYPGAYVGESARVNDAVIERLSEVAARRDDVRFLPSDALPPVGEADFEDGLHLSFDAGERLGLAVLQRLE